VSGLRCGRLRTTCLSRSAGPRALTSRVPRMQRVCQGPCCSRGRSRHGIPRCGRHPGRDPPSPDRHPRAPTQRRPGTSQRGQAVQARRPAGRRDRPQGTHRGPTPPRPAERSCRERQRASCRSRGSPPRPRESTQHCASQLRTATRRPPDPQGSESANSRPVFGERLSLPGMAVGFVPMSHQRAAIHTATSQSPKPTSPDHHPTRGDRNAPYLTERHWWPPLGRSHGRQRAVFMSATGQFLLAIDKRVRKTSDGVMVRTYPAGPSHGVEAGAPFSDQQQHTQ
jgi:hypothetical protein